MTNPFSSGSNPFEFLLGDLLKMLGSQAGMNSDIARQMAISIANDPVNQPNVDPIDRIKYEELTKIISIHLVGFESLPESTNPTLKIEVVNGVEWAINTIEDWDKYAKMFQQHAAIEQTSGGTESETNLVEKNGQEDLNQMIQNLSKMIGPSMIAMQMGSMVGHLSKVAFGSYEIAVPRPTRSTPMVISHNVDSFASDWELPLDQVRLWATLRELVMANIIGSPRILRYLESLFTRHIQASRTSLKNIQDRLSGLDLSDPEGLQAAMADPSGIFSSEQNNSVQQEIIDSISNAIAVIEGLANNAVSVIGGRLLGNTATISEAAMRRRIERSDGEKLSEQFFGVEISRSLLEKGHAFVQGVIERNGDSGLMPLWSKDGSFPTNSELDAPGLWLARLELDQ